MEVSSSQGRYHASVTVLTYQLTLSGGCDGEGVSARHSPDWSQLRRGPRGYLLQTRQPHGKAVCRG